MNEFDKSQKKDEAIKEAIKEELENLKKEPSPETWKAISQRIDWTSKDNQKGKKGSFRRFWQAASVAAALVLLLAGSVYLFQEDYFLADDPRDEMTETESDEMTIAEEAEEDVELEETPDLSPDEAEETPDNGIGIAEMEQTLEEPVFGAKVPAAIGDLEYRETLGPSTDALVYLLYASPEREIRLVKALAPPFEREVLLQRLEEDQKKEIELVEIWKGTRLLRDTLDRPLLLWETSGDPEALWVLWSVDEDVTGEDLKEYYRRLPADFID